MDSNIAIMDSKQHDCHEHNMTIMGHSKQHGCHGQQHDYHEQRAASHRHNQRKNWINIRKPCGEKHTSTGNNFTRIFKAEI